MGVSGTFFHHRCEKDFDLDELLCFIPAMSFCFFTVYNIPNSQYYPTTLTHFSFS